MKNLIPIKIRDIQVKVRAMTEQMVDILIM